MIAADTSTFVAYYQCEPGTDVDLLDRALRDSELLMVPAVLTELLSFPELPAEDREILLEMPLVETTPGYWQRAGDLRARVLAKGRKARLGDALIAQSCIDRDIPLLTRDQDFRAFSEAAGLHLVI